MLFSTCIAYICMLHIDQRRAVQCRTNRHVMQQKFFFMGGEFKIKTYYILQNFLRKPNSMT